MWFSVWILQVGGSVVAFLILTYLIWRGTQDRQLVVGTVAASLLMLIAVLAMRWNVVIGGQELSKTMQGLLYYYPTFLGREGILASIIVFALPFGVLWVLTRLLPPWVQSEGHTGSNP